VIETTSFRVWGVRDTGQAGEDRPARFHQSGTRRCHPPLVGDFTLDLDRAAPSPTFTLLPPDRPTRGDEYAPRDGHTSGDGHAISDIHSAPQAAGQGDAEAERDRLVGAYPGADRHAEPDRHADAELQRGPELIGRLNT
jgi:hypothetical protein